MRKLVVMMALLAAGCKSGAPSFPVDPGAGAPPELAASLGARVHGDSVAFTLRVSNATNGPVRIEFVTGQRYDFEVGTPAGKWLWQWSAAMRFMQSLGAEELKPGETLEYSAEWPGARPGKYVVRGRIVSANKPVDLRTEFSVPTH